LYKWRWQVELFFKWIKLHLRIKRFYGTSENAVRTQIWIAISVYVLEAIVKKQLKLGVSLAYAVTDLVVDALREVVAVSPSIRIASVAYVEPGQSFPRKRAKKRPGGCPPGRFLFRLP
jgi:hypothetical protein